MSLSAFSFGGVELPISSLSTTQCPSVSLMVQIAMITAWRTCLGCHYCNACMPWPGSLTGPPCNGFSSLETFFSSSMVLYLLPGDTSRRQSVKAPQNTRPLQLDARRVISTQHGQATTESKVWPMQATLHACVCPSTQGDLLGPLLWPLGASQQHADVQAKCNSTV
jgi:hypothetical protein